MSVKTSIIVPTYNEHDNIKPLLEGLFNAANDSNLDIEVIIVDDNSPDKTADHAESFSEKYDVKVVRRAGKLGLSTAVIEGFARASNEIIGVMDADLSHDPKAFPRVVRPVLNGSSELSVGSRYVAGGATKDWGVSRRIISHAAGLLCAPLTKVKDPMSGFFFTKKEVIDRARLDPVGFKILLEIIVKCRPENIMEIPIEFHDRMHGESKLSLSENINYLKHLMRLYSFKIGIR